MNIANKISLFRFYLVIVMVSVLLFPYYSFGITVPTYFVGNVPITLDYIVAGVIFVIASASDFLDGYIARKYNLVTTFGKFIDPVADKLIVNTTLIILTSVGRISPMITVIMIARDIIVDAIRMIASADGTVIAASKYGKLKTVTQMIGITLVLFNNLPFEMFDLKVADFFMLLAVAFSVISGIDYFLLNRKFLTKSM